MDYEKKYNDALDWMREVYPTLNGSTKEDAEHYFPELKDSEDERIRKEIVEYFQNLKGVATKSKNFDKWIAYLEKQKEQEPAEWSEEDEQYLLVCKNALSKYQRSDQWDANIISRWLENRLKSLHPQPKMAWRKYTWHSQMRFDKSALVKYDITGAYEIVTAGCRPRSEQNGIYVFLEDINPQPHWKPSEEQIGILGKVFAGCQLKDSERDSMVDLFYHLKDMI